MSIKTKILIAEHDPVDLELLEYQLKLSGIDYVSEVVQTELDYGKAIENFIPDIILSDYTFPSFDGLTALKIREKMAPETPFIFISGTIGEAFSIELIKNGVTDFTLKESLFTINTKVLRALRESSEKQQKKKAEQENRAKAELLNTIGQAVIVADLNGIISFWNTAAAKTYGWTAEEAIGNNILDLIPSQQTKERAAEIMNELFQGYSWSGELIMQRKNGTSFTAFITDSPVYDSNHKLTGIIGISSDLTERIKNEEKLNKANRLYAFMSHINKTITLVKDEQSLFKEACSIACNQGKFKVAWIGKIDKEHHTINLVEQSGMPAETLRLFVNALYEKDGAQDQVLRTGNSYTCNNIETGLKLNKGKEQFASPHQIRSYTVLPINKAGLTIGTFNLYSDELNFFDAAETKMLREVAADISFGLELFEKEKLQKETEELVIRSEKLFRALTENSTNMKTLTSKEGKVLYGSPSIEKGLGYTMEEILLKFPQDLIHADELQHYLEKRNEILQTPGKSFHFQHRRLHKNGTWIWCEGTLTNMLEDSAVQAMVSNFNDISKQKNAEDLRKFDSNNLNALINNTTDLMWSVDREFNLITTNKAFDESIKLMTGSTIAKGNTVLSEGFPEEQLKKYKNIYERAFSGETFTEIEHTHSPAENWIEISYNPIRSGGDIIGAACHSRDITERIKTEETSLRLASIVESSRDAIIGLSLDGLIVSWNQAAKILYEYSPEEVLGKPYSVLLDPGHADQFTKNVERVKAGELPGHFELEHILKSGNLIYVSISISPVKDVAGKLSGIATNAHDISKQKKAEVVLKRAADKAKIKWVTKVRIELALSIIGAILLLFLFVFFSVPEKIYESIGKSQDSILDDVILVMAFVSVIGIVFGIRRFWEANKGGQQVQNALRTLTNELESRVQERTNELSKSNEVLMNEIIGRNRAEENLKQSEARLKEAQALSHISNWQIDLLTGVSSWSDEFYNIVEIKQGDVQPTAELFLSCIHADDFKHVKKKIEKTLKTFEGSSFYAKIKSKNRSPKYVYSEWNFEIDKNNKPIRIYGILQDVTERKLAEFQFNEINERFINSLEDKNTILESIGDGFFAVDKNWTVTYWNNQAEKLLRTPKDVILGGDLWEIFSNSADSESYKKYHEAIETKKVIHFEDYYPALDKWYEISAYPSDNGLAVYFKDITDRKLSEINLTELNADLRIQAQELALSNAELEQFAYVASHDLQEPLRTVTSYLTLLEKKYENIIDGKGKKYIDFAVDGSKRMRHIIEDLLEFSRIGKTEDNLEDINLNEVINEIQISFQKQIDEQGAIINVEQIPVINCYKTPIRQAFQNLISNALKYSRKDVPAKIKISATTLNDYWQFCVADNGIGINSEYFDKIFIIFQRLHNKDEFSGTGIGLPITKKIVESLGGKIWVESEEGKGSSFYFTIAKRNNET